MTDVAPALENALYLLRRWMPSLQPSLLGLRAPPLWWDVAGEESPDLCVSGAAFLHPEATSCSTLSWVSQSPLSGSAEMGWEGMSVGKQVSASVALYFPVGSTAMSKDHLGWNVASAPLQSVR